MAILQIALDVVDLERALSMASDAVKGGVDWLEVGTPLMKSEGMRAVRAMKKKFPDKVVVADMKTMDTGALEAEMAAKSGADVIVVLGAADDSTIREAAKAAHRHGARLMADLIGCGDFLKRAKELEKMGVDYVCAHVGIDEQMKGKRALAEAKRIASGTRIPIAVAGGITRRNAGEAAKYAEVVIVGGAITKSGDIAKETRAMKKLMAAKKKGKSGLYRRYGEKGLLEAFSKVSTPNISDAMQKRGEMKEIKNIAGKKFAGTAFTVRTSDGDWAKPVEAIESAGKGDVIVIECSGATLAVWGELASHSCKQKGIAGVVMDGAVRDVDEIKRIGFPACARRVVATAGEPRGWGEMNCEIECGGEKVKPGDWIVGDENGVMVVPKESAAEIANRALDVMERENRIRSEIAKGKTLSEVVYLKRWEKV